MFRLKGRFTLTMRGTFWTLLLGRVTVVIPYFIEHEKAMHIFANWKSTRFIPVGRGA